jgi:hypothetical protein
MPQSKTNLICPHCNLQSANEKICTNRCCGKRLTAPVRLFARLRRPPAAIPLKFRKRWVQ